MSRGHRGKKTPSKLRPKESSRDAGGIQVIMAWTFRNLCYKFDNCDNAMNFRNNASNKCCADLVVNYGIDFTKKTYYRTICF